MKAGGANGDFKVRVSRKEVVAASPTQEQILPLSNLDVLLPPVDVGVFFCYKSPTKFAAFSSMISTLKKSLAQTLASFYVFAGELSQNANGELQLLCNNNGSGVDFIEASADAELKDLNLYDPHQSVDGKLVPTRNQGVLAIQVALDLHTCNST